MSIQCSVPGFVPTTRPGLPPLHIATLMFIQTSTKISSNRFKTWAKIIAKTIELRWFIRKHREGDLYSLLPFNIK